MPWQVRKLTPYQVRHICFHERDKHGTIVPKVVGWGGPETEEEILRKRWRERFKLSDKQLDQKWAEFLRMEGYRAHLEGQPGADPEKIDAQVREFERKIIAER